MAQPPARSGAGRNVWPDLGGGGSGRRGAGRMLSYRSGMAGGGLKMTQSNKRMHATADTTILMLRERCGAARDARR